MLKKGSPNQAPPHFDLTTKQLSVAFTILFQKNEVTSHAVADFSHPLRGVQDRNQEWILCALAETDRTGLQIDAYRCIQEKIL